MLPTEESVTSTEPLEKPEEQVNSNAMHPGNFMWEMAEFKGETKARFKNIESYVQSISNAQKETHRLAERQQLMAGVVAAVGSIIVIIVMILSRAFWS